jgi:hypothetical protein
MPAGLTMHARHFSLPRRGSRVEECEDACASDRDRGRFAIADGAGASSYAGVWARLLVEQFVRLAERWPDWATWLPPLQKRWAAAVGWPPRGGGLPWFVEADLHKGAFATFLGLVVEDGAWHATAVGDSCLFQVRGGGLLGRFPLARSADFGSNPWLIGSLTAANGVPVREGLRSAGDCQGGDRLWLMTDALAQWFLEEHEQGGRPWAALERLMPGPVENFASWVEQQRSAGRLRDDDVTLLGVYL